MRRKSDPPQAENPAKPDSLFSVERNLQMTIAEAGTRYNIPLDILREYESRGL